MPAVLSRVTATKTPRNAILFTVIMAGLGLLLGLNDGAVATVILSVQAAYRDVFMTTGVGLSTRLTGRWNPALGKLNLGIWGLVINIIAFLWTLFELVNIAWPRVYAVSANAPWWQLWAIPLVLGSILSFTTLYILINKIRNN